MPQATQQDLKSWKIPEFGKIIEEQLTELKTRCCNFPDSRLMAKHVLSRLEEVYGRIVRDKKVSGDKEVVEFVKVVTGFAKHLKTTVTQISFSQRVKSQRIVFGHHTYHTKIDCLLGVLKVSLTDPVREWETLYDAHVTKLSISGLERGSNKQSGFETLVSRNTLKSIKYQSPSSLSAVTVRQADTESESTGWLIKLNQIEYDADAPIAEGGFGTIYRGVWLWGTQVVVKFIHNDKEVSDSLFLHEVNIWHRLQHPHVVRLRGACNVGKRYFVCEYASNGTLSEYLRRQSENLGPEKLLRLKWKLLHDVALGLQYVHGRSVVHNNLKCDNILVGDDEKAKLTDFGLSSIPNRLDLTFDPKQIGAIPWKAPEYLESGVPSFESDIYSFAVCIVEVFTESTPYGGQIPAAVKRHIKNGVIPLKPDALDDNERNLIELMTRKEPAQRVGISFVVDRLQELAVVDSSATTEL